MYHLVRRDRIAKRDRLTPRMEARQIIDSLDMARAARPEARARAEAIGDGTRVEVALLAMLGFEEVNDVWLDPEGCRLDGGYYEALDEACALVENGDLPDTPSTEDGGEAS
ncbi:hypothetical protein GKE82_24160 [Conexibacter sp. W3-3-2]|uniref:hypothetical protein n=1 Tax=Conexibacter sp. W3-3-2 TaxID=2675227 RepID=UPI0012B8D4B6|nr:hypothetical protein [Conexibacter sp. W3-3-2]MTD47303.1 hypothetical protein [Conexibacter sp. W3-3-2]